MLKMCTFSFDARREVAKAQNRFADCFIGRTFQIACTAAFGSARFFGFGVNLIKLTRIIIYYYSVLLVNRILCHNDVPTKSSP